MTPYVPRRDGATRAVIPPAARFSFPSGLGRDETPGSEIATGSAIATDHLGEAFGVPVFGIYAPVLLARCVDRRPLFSLVVSAAPLL